MSIFQKLANIIKSWKYPEWMKGYVQDLNDLMLGIIKNAGKDYIHFLKEKILEASREKDWTSRQKFEFVFKQAKAGFAQFGVTLKDNVLNTIINYFVSLLKQQGAI